MATATRIVTNSGDPIVTPNGTVLSGISIVFQLVDGAKLQPVSLFDAASDGGDYVTGTPITAVTDELGYFSVALWPNNRGEVDTCYKVTLPGTTIKPIYVRVTEGDGDLTFVAAKAAMEAIQPQVLSLFDALLANIIQIASTVTLPVTTTVNGLMTYQDKVKLNGLDTALNLKADLASPTFTGTVGGITKAMVGLANVDNTADSAKPVSTIQQSALDLKADLASPTFTGTVGGITKAMVGLANVDNTADSAKPVSTTQQTALDLKANLTSPALTGTPTAPTAAGGTNTTQIATAAFVRGEIAALVNGAAGTLDTLKELADALGDDPNFATTVAASIGLKAAIDSPTFTGAPLAPTAAVNTNTTQLATTAFVLGQVGTANPLMNSTVAVGTSYLYARQDHVHPVDTSRAPLASPVFTGNVTGLGVSTGTSFNAITALASSNPLMNGAVAVGTSTTVARQDHVHPVDTSRAAKAGSPSQDFTTAALTSTSVITTDGTITQYTGLVSGGVAYCGTASNHPYAIAINGSEKARFDNSGNLLVGATSGSCHTLQKSGAEGTQVLNIYGASAFYMSSSSGFNVAATSAVFTKNSSTSRSINAGGTINASGADYAEYIRKDLLCGLILKGAVVGFNADGEITDKWTDAISFGIKSTNPNLVGGDTWGSDDAIGKRPAQPIYEAPVYEGAPAPGAEPTAPVLTLPMQPVQQEGETAETFAARTAQWQEACAAQQTAQTAAIAQHAATLTAWQTAGALFINDQTTYAATVQAAEDAHAEAMAQYATDLAAFEARLETERLKVDRIAFSGICPCNITGASVGDYIIAAQAGDGIEGQAVTTPTFDQYRNAVGRVRRILEDGRAEIAVMVH